MTRVGIRELNQQTSRIIELVRRGEVVEITDRGQAVARLVPVPTLPPPLGQLVAEGRAVPPAATGQLPVPAALADAELDVGAALAGMRDEERW